MGTVVVIAVVWGCAAALAAGVVLVRARRPRVQTFDSAALEERAEQLVAELWDSRAAASAAAATSGAAPARETTNETPAPSAATDPVEDVPPPPAAQPGPPAPDEAGPDEAGPDESGETPPEQPGGRLAAELTYTPELASSLDPDEVLDRILDAVMSMGGVDAALIAIGDESHDRVTRATGLSDDEIERTLLQLPRHPDLRALEVVYRYRLDDVDQSVPLPRAALTVTLRADGEPIGSLAAISRSSRTALSEVALEGLARRAGPAISNALRYTEARAHAELDSLTGLHNRRLFYEFLGREIARAQRYERYVSVIVFDLDDFKRINDRLGHLGGDAVLAEVADRVRAVVRATDIPCRVGGDEFAVILPESARDDAELLADRIALAIRAQKIDKVGSLKISAGVAELRAGDSAADLFERADHALLRAKNTGKSRIVAS
ncbi:MAG TPA: sensor domain-containing diguanylate cyclase [Gaiellaceae bacterium]|nr:sensor domain-containing diguanylate cyclase [Gaiellaceae bacterium]